MSVPVLPMPTREDCFDEALHERLLAWDRKVQADRAAAVARFNRNPFRLARRTKERLRLLSSERARQIDHEAIAKKAAATRAARRDIYAEREAVRRQFTDKRVRWAMALNLRRQGKTYREIGEIVGCGAEHAKIVVERAKRDERWRWRVKSRR